MISIQSGMLVALGFLIASLVALLLASAFWSRAVRLTTKRLKASLPVSEPEIKADLDRLRATYAIRVHKLEAQLDQARHEKARQLVEINRRDASISGLETDVIAIRAELEENLNARRVLEQTVADRLPKVEARLAEAKRLLFNRDREIAELAQGARRHKAALEEATSINAQRSAEIERLSTALATKGGRRRRAATGESEPEGEIAMRAEAEALRAKTREQATLIDRLQRRLGEGYVVTAALAGAEAAPAALAPGDSALGQSSVERARENLHDAEQTLQLARSVPLAEEPTRAEQDKTLRALKARAEDQAGEIARLRAALAAFEQVDAGGAGLKNSRLALKARAGSAEAQAERQAATIAKLRAELASANERLAQQAAHFLEELRRVGSGAAATASPATGPARRNGRESGQRRLAERVAEVPVRPAEPAAAPFVPAAAPTEETAMVMSAPASNPANGAENAAPALAAVAEAALPPPGEPAPASSPAPTPVAAEMPQTATIRGEGRKVRLLDRITGLGKP
ncbi:MAG TPA: hypothetical protein VFY92_06960 [Hyphomicrobiaceae bacterium]|nr:hypothetical protein [Hyphomicrobiaceae bacterium]